MSLFHRDIKKRIEKHIKELEKYLGEVPDNWIFWWDHHKKEIKYIKYLDNKIIKDIVKLHKTKENENLKNLAQELFKDLKIMQEQADKSELPYEVQEKEKIVIDNILKRMEELGLKNVVVKNLKDALKKMQGDLSELVEAFKPIFFGKGNIHEQKKIVASKKLYFEQKGMPLLGVGNNGIVLKVNLLGNDYALKIGKKLKDEITNLKYAQGIKGVPKFYFNTKVKEFDAILMEFVIGPILEDYVKTHVLPNDFFERVETFVKKLHMRGMAHRDLQGENIKLVGNYPMFMDFGLASPKATSAEKRFDIIFVEDLKLQYLKYTEKYHNNPRALAAVIQMIINRLTRMFQTETNHENRDTIEMFISRAKKRAA